MLYYAENSFDVVLFYFSLVFKWFYVSVLSLYTFNAVDVKLVNYVTYVAFVPYLVYYV